MKKTKILTLGLLGVASTVALASCGSSKKGYTDMPTIDFIFNSNSGNQKIAETVQAQLKTYGIKMNLSQDQWASFLQTRKQGNYTCARNGWLADYNDPISFLDMWVSGSGNNDCQLGKDANGLDANYTYTADLSSIEGYTKLTGNWKSTYDVLIGYIKKEQDSVKRYKLMHKAETLLMSTGVITPIYNYIDNWLQKDDLTNVYAAPLGYKYFTWAKNGANNSPITAVLASKPDQIDPALNTTVDGGSYDVHLFSGLVRYTPKADKSGIELTTDLIKEFSEPKVAADGKCTYTFTLVDGAKFSNGDKITAQDVVDSWNRAASYNANANMTAGLDADYGYMFECIDGYDSLGDTSTDADVKNFLNVKATSENTLTVTTVQEYPYFKELLAFPAYAVLHDAWNLDKDGAWAKASSAVTSGAYKIKSYSEAGLVIEKNDNYWDAANTTTNSVTFAFSDDDSQMFGGYQDGTYQLIDSMTSETVKKYKNNTQYHVIGTLGTYYYSWNINAKMFSGMTQEQAQDVRTAISLLINRKYIVESVTGTGETVSTGFVGAGLSDAAGGEFVDHNGVNEDGSGWTGKADDYAANVEAAKTLLNKYYKYKN